MDGITRRGFLSALPAVAAVPTDGKWGHMTLERWESLGMRGTHDVLCNGSYITDACVAFDDVEGWADVLISDRDGTARMDKVTGQHPRGRRFGAITVQRRPVER